MKPRLLASPVAALSTFVLLLTAVQSQGAPAPKPQDSPRNTAVIDINQVLTNHTRLKVLMAEMKADIARAENRVKTEQGEIKKMAEGLKDLLAGTRDYLDLQEKINKRAEDLKTQVQLQRSEFVQREAKVYRVVYREIVNEIADYAKENGIEMVFRIANLPSNDDSPQQVLQEVNRQIVWWADGRDITQAILERLNKKAAQAKPAEKPPQPKPAEKPAAKPPVGKPATEPQKKP
jgi:Skp family chaperone for outer membrane proteins